LAKLFKTRSQTSPLPFEIIQMSRLFKNGEMRGTKKIQARCVLGHT
jgi:hypothetical protein